MEEVDNWNCKEIAGRTLSECLRLVRKEVANMYEKGEGTRWGAKKVGRCFRNALEDIEECAEDSASHKGHEKYYSDYSEDDEGL